MDNVISSILEAEKKADEIIASAAEKAKNIILEGESAAEKIRETAVWSFKAQKKGALLSAEKKASEEYNRIIETGKNKAQDVYTAAVKKSAKAADELIKDFLK